jgi:hypothetical protein
LGFSIKTGCVFSRREWLGDGGYGTHEFDCFAYRHRRRLTLVSKFPKDANLYHPAPIQTSGTNGRPRSKGKPMAKPETVVARMRKKKKKLKVTWYGGGTRLVEYVTGVGHWFKSGVRLVPIRWVYVRDLSGTHRDEYFFTTDLNMSPKAIIELYGARWNIETTFQELRSQMGLETTRGWSRQTVLRMAPCLILSYTLIVLFYDQLTKTRAVNRTGVHWRGKSHTTFSNMHATVRRYLWMEWVFAQAPGGKGVRKLSRPVQKLIDFGLTQAA